MYIIFLSIGNFDQVERISRKMSLVTLSTILLCTVNFVQSSFIILI